MVRIRLWGKKGEGMMASAPTSEDLTDGVAAGDSRVVSHRQFLKTLAAAVGLAGLGQVATAPPGAEATYIPGPPDTVDTDLTVQGILKVKKGDNGTLHVFDGFHQIYVKVGDSMHITAWHGLKFDTNQNGVITPRFAIDSAGNVAVNGVTAVDSSGTARQSYYA